MLVFTVFVAWLVVVQGGFALTAWFLVRVWKRKRQVSLPTLVLATIAAGFACFGAIGSLLGLAMGFRAIGGESLDPSDKARMLAEGISEAMNFSAFGILGWVPSMVVALVLARKRSEEAP